MTLPVTPVAYPAVLAGQSNGQLPPGLLVSTPGLAGGPVVRLLEPAARAWRRLTAEAARAGIVLKATSAADSYRTRAQQRQEFLSRYTTTPIPGASTRTWQGRTWYLKPGNAPAAAPGTSNHGWGLAVDVGTELDGDPGTESLGQRALAWLRANAPRWGWSWELQSEPWHLRYVAGDPGGRNLTGGAPMSQSLAGGAPTRAQLGDDDDGPFPTVGPRWAPWNLPSVVGNTVVGAGQETVTSAAQTVLSGARHIATEALVSLLGLGLIALGVWRATTATTQRAGRSAGRLLGGA